VLDDVQEVLLGVDDIVDVFVGAGDFVNDRLVFARFDLY
jgi:hypothetical protein